MIDEGLNAGVTGLLCLQGQSNVKFVGDVLGWDQLLGVGVFDDAGRADSIWGNKLPLSAGGTITLKGMTNLDGQPTPNDYRGERGPLVLTQTTGVTETVTVMVTSSRFIKSTKEDQLWDFVHVCSIVAAPALAGWGGTNAAATQSYGDKELWAGMSKTLDPQTLQSGATQRWRIWGIGDNDAAEKTKIDSHLGALVAPYSGMKLRPCTFTRLSTNVCISETTWGLTDTAEDVINAATTITVDPSGRTSRAVTAVFNGTPGASSGLVRRGRTTKEYNDIQILSTDEHGTRSTIEDLTFGNTKYSTDVSVLSKEYLFCKSFTTGSPPVDPTPPSGVVITDYFDVPDTSPDSTNLSYRVYIGALVSNADKVTLGQYELATDPNNLDTSKRSGVIWDSGGSPPADPGLPSGLLLLSRTDIAIPTHPTKQIRVYRWDTLDSILRRTYPRKFDDVDPQGLESKSADSAMDSTPSTPAGLMLRSTKTEPVTPAHNQTTVEAGERSTADDRTFPRTKVSIDRGSIKTRQETYTAAMITTGDAFVLPSAPSAGMVCTDYFDVPETNASASNKSIRVYVWSLATNIEQLQQPRYSNRVDPNGLDTTVRSAIVWDGTSAPSNPALTGIRSGLKLVDYEDVGIPSHPATLVRVYLHEKNDSLDKLLLPRTTFEATSFLAQRAENPSLITTTSAASVTGLSVFNSFKDQITFEKVFAVKTDPDHTLQIITTQVAAKIVRGRSSGTRRVITPAFWDGTDVWVFMRRKIKIGTNSWDYELAEQYLYGQKICFSISQRVSGSTLPYHPDLLNTKNGSPFLGLAAGYVTYLGVADSATNLAVSSDRVSEISWEFEYDSLGIIDMADASPGWSNTSTDLTSVGPGWVKASDLGLSSTVVDDGDYSVFA